MISELFAKYESGAKQYIWGVSRKLATSVNQGDKILTMMDVLKCTQITLLRSY